VGFFDSSRSENVTNLTDATTTNTTQTDQSGGSLNFSGIGGGVSLGFSESNQLIDDRDIYDSRSSSTSIVDSGNTYTTLSDAGAIAAGRDVGLGGLNLAGSALSTVQKVNADSLTMLGALVDKSIDASRTLARDSAESTAGFLEQAVAGFGSLAKASSEGDADKITRVVGFALLAVVVAVVGPAIFRGGLKGVIP
jgi:hypothetical protein